MTVQQCLFGVFQSKKQRKKKIPIDIDAVFYVELEAQKAQVIIQFGASVSQSHLPFIHSYFHMYHTSKITKHENEFILRVNSYTLRFCNISQF